MPDETRTTDQVKPPYMPAVPQPTQQGPAGLRFDFNEGERVHTEYSYKYDMAGIEALARSGGFRIAETWTDPARLFAVVYLEAA